MKILSFLFFVLIQIFLLKGSQIGASPRMRHLLDKSSCPFSVALVDCAISSLNQNSGILLEYIELLYNCPYLIFYTHNESFGKDPEDNSYYFDVADALIAIESSNNGWVLFPAAGSTRPQTTTGKGSTHILVMGTSDIDQAINYLRTNRQGN